ncbi:MAG: ABC transporter permease [Anaerolineae bacterium]|nr:ABC transporter permease [Anaerolineae bacterium]
MRTRDILLAALAIFVLWQAAAMTLQRDILPAPTEVLVTFTQQIARDPFCQAVMPGLACHFWVSTARVVTALLLSVVVAVPLGLALGQSRLANRILGPVIYLLYPIPKIVFLPIILLFLGIGEGSKVFIIFIILVFQVLVVVRDSASALRPELLASVKSLGAGRRALFRYVYLPATVPAAITALRISVGTAVAVLFFAETVATRTGLGYYIITDANSRLAYREMYAGVVAMSMLGLLLYLSLDRLERRLAPWMFTG